MKYFLALLFCVCLLPTLHAQKQGLTSETAKSVNADSAFAQIQFENPTFSFGEIVANEVVKTSFDFTNVGNAPLVIKAVQTTCGCTAANWPKNTPVLPGQSANIEVVFDSNGKIGRHHKLILVFSNAINFQQKLEIIGTVLPK